MEDYATSIALEYYEITNKAVYLLFSMGHLEKLVDINSLMGERRAALYQIYSSTKRGVIPEKWAKQNFQVCRSNGLKLAQTLSLMELNEEQRFFLNLYDAMEFGEAKDHFYCWYRLTGIAYQVGVIPETRRELPFD